MLRATLVTLVTIAAVPTSWAEERLEQTQIPDIDIFEAMARRPYATSWAHRLQWDAGVVAPARGGDINGLAQLRAGVRSKSWIALLRSEWSGAIDRDDTDLDQGRGRHRLLWLGNFGERRGPGVRLELDATAAHGSQLRYALAAPEIGPATFVDSSVGSVVELRLGKGCKCFNIAVPVVTRARSIRYRGAGPVDEAQSFEIGAALAATPGDDEALRGRFDLIGMSVKHTLLESSTVPLAMDDSSLSSQSLREIRLRMGFRDVTFYERDFIAVATFQLGWTWLRNDTRGLRDDLFELDAGSHIRWESYDGTVKRVGLGIGRRPGHTADGARIVAEWRFELSSDLETKRAGASVRAGLGFLSSKKASDDVGLLERYGIHTEAYAKLQAGIRLGVYAAAASEPVPVHRNWDPWRRDLRDTGEVGVFLRWTGELESSRRRYYIAE